MLTFVIPVRHPENMRNARLAKSLLGYTVISIAAQTNSDWQGVVVANHGTDLPSLPPRFSVKWVDLPPNTLHEQRDMSAFRKDKGMRVLHGMDMRESDYFMTVDDDDLVSNRLAAHVFGKMSDGWCFKDGYLYDGKTLGDVSNLHEICGTSHILSIETARILADRPEGVEIFGSHSMLHQYVTLDTLPFPGAVYRTGHANAHSQLYLHPKSKIIFPDVPGPHFADDIQKEFFGEG